MLKQSSIKKDFEALCNQYGLQVEQNKVLQAIYEAKQEGLFQMPSFALDNMPVFDLAKMLKQLYKSAGTFTLKVGGGKEDYSSPILVEVLKQLLNQALKERVRKQNETWVDLGVMGYEKFPIGKKTNIGASMVITLWDWGKQEKIILYPEGVIPSQDTFSEWELEAIIDTGKELERVVEKMQGNGSGTYSPTRNPELGEMAILLKSHLPEEWNSATQNSFIADFLLGAGFLDFKGDSWLDDFKDKGKAEKDRLVRNWIDSSKQSHLKQ